MAVTNQKSKEEIKKDIEDVLDEPTPDINEPIEPEPSEPIPSEPIPSDPAPEPEPSKPPEPEPIPEPVKPIIPEPEPEPINVPEVKAPTDEELRSILAADGIDLDELTNFEKSQAKKTFVIQKRQMLIDEAFQSQKKQSDWSKKVNTFIDSTNNDPKYKDLDGHEAEFKVFALQYPESDIESLLLPAFLHQLPKNAPKRGSLFEKGGGGEAPAKPKEGIDDAELVKKLRESDPREYRRQLKAGKIKLEVD